MNEFIEKLIGRLEELLPFSTMSGEYIRKKDAIKIVNQLAEEYRQDLDKDSQYWIPTTERLPEKNAIVLTCDKDGWISVKVNMPYAGVKNDFECGYYVAWMPLPEPFKPISE